MAKTSGPLASFDASGKFADTIVFAKWRGVRYARLLVKPGNPRSDKQIDARLYAAMAGKIIKAAKNNGTIAEALKKKTPTGQSWNSFFVKEMLGKGNVNVKAVVADYKNAANATVKGYFDTVAVSKGVESAAVPGTTDTVSPGLALMTAYAAVNRLNLASAPTLATAASQTQVEAFAHALID